MDAVFVIIAVVAGIILVLSISEGESSLGALAFIVCVLFTITSLMVIYMWPPTITEDKFIADRFDNIVFDKPVTVLVTKQSYTWRVMHDKYSYRVTTGCGGEGGEVQKR
jgi:hypothetical protein